MSNDIYHQEIYTHKSGKKYHVCWYYDHDYGSPLENGDGYGVTERMDWNPTDEEQLEQHIADYEPELEELDPAVIDADDSDFADAVRSVIRNHI